MKFRIALLLLVLFYAAVLGLANLPNATECVYQTSGDWLCRSKG